LSGSVGFLEACDQVGQGAVVDAAAVLGGGDGETDRQVGLADTRRTEKHDVLSALDEAERRERFDLLPLQRRLEAEVEVRDRKSTRLNSSHVKISYAVFCL